MSDLRPVTEADLPALSRRLTAEFPHDGYTIDNLHWKIQRDPNYDPELSLLIPGGQGVAAAVLGALRGTNGFIKVITVRPDTAQADLLLAEVEERLRQRGATELHATGSSPSYFLPGVDPTDTLTLRFYLEHGFERVKETFNMTCDLTTTALDTTADVERLAAAGLRVARLGPADTGALERFMLAFFSPGWLIETLWALDFTPVPCHVVWDGEQIVAFAAAECTNPSWFGPMGTAPSHRRHGLGRVLLLRCLDDLRLAGYRQAQIGWVGPLGFYARHCGAQVSRVFWQLRKSL